MLSFRGSDRKRPVPKLVGHHLQVQPSCSVIPPVPLLEIAKAYTSSLKTTLANSLKDNTDLRLKLVKAKQDLKEARQKNKSLADYNEWRRKAELGYDVGFDNGAKQVLEIKQYIIFLVDL